jgi:hypothetical protein
MSSLLNIYHTYILITPNIQYYPPITQTPSSQLNICSDLSFPHTHSQSQINHTSQLTIHIVTIIINNLKQS